MKEKVSFKDEMDFPYRGAITSEISISSVETIPYNFMDYSNTARVVVTVVAL